MKGLVTVGVIIGGLLLVPSSVMSSTNPSSDPAVNSAVQSSAESPLRLSDSLTAAETQSPASSTPELLDWLSVSSRLNASLEWNPIMGIGRLETAGQRIVFRTTDQESASQDLELSPNYTALLNGSLAYSGPSPVKNADQLLFPAAFIDSIEAYLKRLKADQANRFQVAAILIDAGHGGKDSGAVAYHELNGIKVEVQEKDINLRAAKMIHGFLTAKYPDKQILLSRDDDRYLSLEQRVAIANEVTLSDNQAIVFISIHSNASFNKAASGYEVWYLSPKYRRTVVDEQTLADNADLFPILNSMMEEAFTTESLIIAKTIMDRLDQAVGHESPARGIKAEEWFVVRNAKMPSVLIELGFVTNPEEAARLLSDEYLRRISEAVYNGVVDFVTIFESSGGFTSTP